MAKWIEENKAREAAVGRLRDRHQRIRLQLDYLKEHGVIQRHYTVRGSELRWYVETRTGTSRAFTTAEVEAFILGAEAAQK
jgi:ribosomal protein S8